MTSKQHKNWLQAFDAFYEWFCRQFDCEDAALYAVEEADRIYPQEELPA